MNYSTLTLIGLGIFGILFHCLVELHKLNKASAGNLNIKQYLRLELFSILISFFMVIAAVLIKAEIQQLDFAGKWLGVGFIAIGYMGQSLLVVVMGKASKVVNQDTEGQSNSEKPTEQV